MVCVGRLLCPNGFLNQMESSIPSPQPAEVEWAYPLSVFASPLGNATPLAGVEIANRLVGGQGFGFEESPDLQAVGQRRLKPFRAPPARAC